jgi:hypothetical protein
LARAPVAAFHAFAGRAVPAVVRLVLRRKCAHMAMPCAGRELQFTGSMMIRKANGLSKWHPTAQVGFTDLGFTEDGCHCNGIVATWHPEYPDAFLVSLLADGKEIELGLVPYDKPVTFKLTFARDGALKLEVGSGVATGRSAITKRNNLHMSCSTADVDFDVTVATPVEQRSPERCPFAAQEQWTAEDVDRYCRVRR